MNTTLIFITTAVEYIIFAVLVILSVWSIGIILDRKRVLKNESDFDFENYKKLLNEGRFKDLQNEKIKNFVTQGLLTALEIPTSQSISENFTVSVDRKVSSYIKQQRIELEKGLSVLATLGSNAAFIGLFGTVLGIIRSFAYLGTQSGSQAVMSGVSQALYATAIGLFVAIPAVVAYNIYSKQIKTLIMQTEALKDEYISKILSQHGG
jgi:biopolymer transport protein ExbB